MTTDHSGHFLNLVTNHPPRVKLGTTQSLCQMPRTRPVQWNRQPEDVIFNPVVTHHASLTRFSILGELFVRKTTKRLTGLVVFHAWNEHGIATTLGQYSKQDTLFDVYSWRPTTKKSATDGPSCLWGSLSICEKLRWWSRYRELKRANREVQWP